MSQISSIRTEYDSYYGKSHTVSFGWWVDEDEGQKLSIYVDGIKMRAIQLSLSQYVKPTRRTTNPLLVSKDPSDESNLVSSIVADSGPLTGFQNLPPAWTSGPVFALRLVHWLSDNHCAVWLLESYPKRRVWSNFYNINAWSGWEQS